MMNFFDCLLCNIFLFLRFTYDAYRVEIDDEVNKFFFFFFEFEVENELKMNFSRKILSLNINSIECNAKKSLLKDFVIQADVEIIFFQEVCFQDFSFLFGFQKYVNLDDR
jgi:hypothetical protein